MSTWKPKKLKYIGEIISGGTPESGNPGYWEGSVLWLTPVDLGKEGSYAISDSSRTLTPAGAKAAGLETLPIGTIVVSTRAPIGSVGLLACKATINQGCKALVPDKHKMDSKFSYYFFLDAAPVLQSLGLGTTFIELSTYSLKNLGLKLPSLFLQRRIAAFLDRQTEKIDRLMNLRKRQIELLKEQRAAIIQRAVTRGLKPDAPMKDSGIPWLGEIPAHWEIVRMKMLAESLIAGPFGSSITKNMYVSSGYRVYGQEQVIPNDFSIGDYFITPEKFEELERYSVNPGDVLISCVGSFGKIAVVPRNIHPGIINPRLLRLRPRKNQIIPEYLGAALRSNVGFAQMEQAGRGGTMDIINIGLLGQLRIPLPPKNEQETILKYIAIQNLRLETLLSAYSRQLALLAEYRAALIHECVTGRKEIPEMPPLAREVAHAL